MGRPQNRKPGSRQTFPLGHWVVPPPPCEHLGNPPPKPCGSRLSPQAGQIFEPPSLSPLVEAAASATWAQLGAQGFSLNLVLLSPEGGAATVPGFPIHYSRCLLVQGKERREGEEMRAGGRRGGQY